MAIGLTNVDNMKQIINIMYPVGSVYINANSDTLPSVLSLFGTWEKIEGKFLLSSSSSYSIKSTGGEVEHTLTVDEMPSHRHGMTRYSANTTNVAGSDKIAGTGKDAARNSNYLDAYTWYKGGTLPHNNMPPYLSVAMWKRTA